MLKRLETYFEFAHLGTNWRTEILAGVTTFLTMAYIVLVNPAASTAATCLSAAFGSILMGIVARYPIALAPGMGLNAYFTYTVCLKMHIPWQTALGAVFLSGIIFLALTAGGIRQMILRSIPHELYAAVASGIGLFIAFIGFRNAGLVIGDPETLVGLGNLRNPTTALALLGLILMVALEIRKVRGSILIGVLTTTAIAWAVAFGILHGGAQASGAPVSAAMTWAQNLFRWAPAPGGFHALTGTAFKLDCWRSSLCFSLSTCSTTWARW
jgi:AGZA family xanthine/uracil permease-like MFS transporter